MNTAFEFSGKLEADGIVVRRDLSDTTLHIEYDLNDKTHRPL
jgi:hypothetical protein